MHRVLYRQWISTLDSDSSRQHCHWLFSTLDSNWNTEQSRALKSATTPGHKELYFWSIKKEGRQTTVEKESLTSQPSTVGSRSVFPHDG